MEEKKSQRLLLFPLPLQGHINPMLELATILYNNGFSITIIHTTFNSPNPSNCPHFKLLPIHESFLQSEYSNSDLVSFIITINTQLVSYFRDSLAKVLDASDEQPVVCLISDAALYFTQAVANEVKLPRMVLRSSGASSFCAFAAFPFLLQKGYIPIQDSRLEEPVVELPPLKVKDLPLIDTPNPSGLYQVVNGMVNGAKTSSGIIWNTFEELEGSSIKKLLQELQVQIFPIGPFHKYPQVSFSCSLMKHDQTCISWLDKQPLQSVIYVSFGSIAAINETEFLEIAWGLANSKQPFLWVVRPGLIRGGSDWIELLPNGFLEGLDGRGHIVKWAPQVEVLGHGSVGAFWSHNGWNSTLESICEGVPMICMPCFTDQKVNARYVSDVWKVGVRFENGLKREEVEKMIKKVMVDEEGKEIRERALMLKDKSSGCLMKNGSSFHSLNNLVNHILSLKA